MNMIIYITPSSSSKNRKSASVCSNCMFDLSMTRLRIKKLVKKSNTLLYWKEGFLHIVDIPIPDHTFYTAHQKALDEIHICVTWRV